MRIGRKRELNSSHKENVLLQWSYICHLLGGFLHVNTGLCTWWSSSLCWGHWQIAGLTRSFHNSDMFKIFLLYLQINQKGIFSGRQVCPSPAPSADVFWMLLSASQWFVLHSPAWWKHETIPGVGWNKCLLWGYFQWQAMNCHAALRVYYLKKKILE